MQGVCNVAVSKNASTVAVVGDVKFDVRFAMQTNEVGCGKQRKKFYTDDILNLLLGNFDGIKNSKPNFFLTAHAVAEQSFEKTLYGVNSATFPVLSVMRSVTRHTSVILAMHVRCCHGHRIQFLQNLHFSDFRGGLLCWIYRG